METCGPLIIFTGVAEFVILLLGLGSEGYGVSVKRDSRFYKKLPGIRENRI